MSQDGVELLLNIDNTVDYPHIILRGGTAAAELKLSGQGSLLTVGQGRTVTLKDITFTGDENNNNASLITVTAGGTLFLEDGALITKNSNRDTYAFGGGAFVGEDGTFTMNGGTISDNSSNFGGGGVFVAGGGAFTLNGGTISGNSTTSGHSPGVLSDGIFIHNGGTNSDDW